MISLFQNTPFIGHSGQELPWKIECDALTEDDWEWAAARVAERFRFRDVEGVARGGLRFAKVLLPHITNRASAILLCDDVLTTGASMEQLRLEWRPGLALGSTLIGVVMFSRVEPPPWVHVIWRFW